MKREDSRSPISVSIIGIRGYPTEFVGTSGVEFYVQHVIRELLISSNKWFFLLYTKKKYQPTFKNTSRISITPLPTVSSKILETTLYSFLASCFAIRDSSSVVWYQGAGSAIWAWIPMAFGKKILLTVHAMDWERKKWSVVERTLFRLLVRFVFFIGPSTTVVSKNLQRELDQKFHVSAIYTPPGISIQRKIPRRHLLDEYHLIPNRYFLFLGRLVPEKHIEILLDSFLESKQQLRAWKLVIAGGHGNMPRYEKMLKAKYADKDIIWTGYVFGTKKTALLAHCGVLVLPSYLEGAPVTLMEALGNRKLCLVSAQTLPNELQVFRNVKTISRGKTKINHQLVELVNTKNQNFPYTYNSEEKEILMLFSWKRTAERLGLAIEQLLQSEQAHTRIISR